MNTMLIMMKKSLVDSWAPITRLLSNRLYSITTTLAMFNLTAYLDCTATDLASILR